MATLYILFSPKLGKFYIGSCLNLDARIQEHKNKTIGDAFTAKTDDWELFFSILNLEYKQARRIEAHIKKMKSKNYILNLKKYPDLADKLIDM